MMGYGFDAGFQMFEIMFFIVFALIAGTILFTIVKGIGEWNQNNQSPVLTVDATVVTKRMDVRRNTGMNADGNASMATSHTWYYVTFQVESGDRMEFSVNGSEYGMIVEGDYGKLTFQGTRYHKFERN